MSGTVLTTNSADPAANNDSTLSSLISTRMSALSIWFEMLSGKDGELIYDLSSGLKKSFHIKHKKNSLGEESYRRFPLRFIDIHIKLRFLAGEIDMMEEKKIALFESKPVPQAVIALSIPTIISSLVMVLYNLADTYFVGMLNDPIQNAAVTLVAPVILAFNAVNNLFGVGASSIMSRALGTKDFDTVRKSSAFGFYCALAGGVLMSILCTVFQNPLLALLGADSTTHAATRNYMIWTVNFGAVPAILNVVLA